MRLIDTDHNDVYDDHTTSWARYDERNLTYRNGNAADYDAPHTDDDYYNLPPENGDGDEGDWNSDGYDDYFDYDHLDGDDYDEVEQVMNHRRVDGALQYLIKWMDYPPSENTWEPEAYLHDYQQALQQYWQLHPQHPDCPLNDQEEYFSELTHDQSNSEYEDLSRYAEMGSEAEGKAASEKRSLHRQPKHLELQNQLFHRAQKNSELIEMLSPSGRKYYSHGFQESEEDLLSDSNDEHHSNPVEVDLVTNTSDQSTDRSHSKPPYHSSRPFSASLGRDGYRSDRSDRSDDRSTSAHPSASPRSRGSCHDADLEDATETSDFDNIDLALEYSSRLKNPQQRADFLSHVLQNVRDNNMASPSTPLPRSQSARKQIATSQRHVDTTPDQLPSADSKTPSSRSSQRYTSSATRRTPGSARSIRSADGDVIYINDSDKVFVDQEAHFENRGQASIQKLNKQEQFFRDMCDHLDRTAGMGPLLILTIRELSAAV